MQILIETERLLIRELLPSDIEGMFEMDSDPEVHRYLGNKYARTKEESAAMISSIRQQYIDHGIGRYAMLEKAGGKFIGWTGLNLLRKLPTGILTITTLGTG